MPVLINKLSMHLNTKSRNRRNHDYRELQTVCYSRECHYFNHKMYRYFLCYFVQFQYKQQFYKHHKNVTNIDRNNYRLLAKSFKAIPQSPAVAGRRDNCELSSTKTGHVHFFYIFLRRQIFHEYILCLWGEKSVHVHVKKWTWPVLVLESSYCARTTWALNTFKRTMLRKL